MIMMQIVLGLSAVGLLKDRKKLLFGFENIKNAVISVRIPYSLFISNLMSNSDNDGDGEY